jgi:hypothetical protein
MVIDDEIKSGYDWINIEHKQRLILMIEKEILILIFNVN